MTVDDQTLTVQWHLAGSYTALPVDSDGLTAGLWTLMLGSRSTAEYMIQVDYLDDQLTGGLFDFDSSSFGSSRAQVDAERSTVEAVLPLAAFGGSVAGWEWSAASESGTDPGARQADTCPASGTVRIP